MVQRNISAPTGALHMTNTTQGGTVFMQKDQQKLVDLIKGKKVAFIGAGVSHKTLIKEFT